MWGLSHLPAGVGVALGAGLAFRGAGDSEPESERSSTPFPAPPPRPLQLERPFVLRIQGSAREGPPVVGIAIPTTRGGGGKRQCLTLTF